MRLNQPVTQHEFLLPDGATLVSTTDLSSHITYCNSAFMAVSGFAREELIGQPHNMIRHPDMPAEAFRDMWDTLQSGAPWSAVVKNRRKNGDHYWVLANATPIMDKGQATGYLSVRTKPSRQQVEAAEALYAQMRAEAQAGKLTNVLRQGRLVKPGWAGRLGRWLRPTMGKQLGTITVLLAWLIHAIGANAQALPDAWRTAAWGVTTVLALVTARLMWGLLTRPLQSTIAFANQMAAGDLSARLDGQGSGEFGALANALNQLNVNLQAVVGDVRHEVESLRVAAGEISSGNQDLSHRTVAQASSIEETAASMEEITATVEQSSQSAAEAQQLSTRAAQVAAQGNTAMTTIVSAMDDIHRSSHRISEIIQVIEGISFQTNILALNAAVEAARAGAQGRGFAVVAAEVRSLAQHTSSAAKEIKQLIGESAAQIAGGTERVHKAGHTMAQVVQAVEQVNGLISDITTATKEQSGGLAQINAAMSDLESATQQNSTMVEQLASSASALRSQAESMQGSVQIFRTR
ncbi:methyl-accepting chemotaxis protein [Hydrogenophaga sp.]|uniref:methyl-accepting chemotaxis protein n=1 Tax=Hydrogenophaga sp. TaxID=1904254 RepID=UPI00286E1F40|nr:methyl-accepting chemotaxis protein [Hydrogenophaga sp.]